MTVPALSTVSIEEYYFFESCVLSEAKHEFFDGLIIAMTGGSPVHAQLAGEVIGQFKQPAKSAGCVVYSSDLRVRAPSMQRAVYPDVSIICGPIVLDVQDRQGETATNPKVIVEVLSPSTSKTDFETKLPAYQSIETLRSILYVHQRERRVEVWTRLPSGRWAWYEHTEGAFEVLGVSGLMLDVDGLYEGVEVK